MSDPPAKAPESGDSEVPFDGGCIGMLLVLLAFVTAFFGIAAFDSEFAGILAEKDTRRNFVGLFRIGAVDAGALLAAAAGGWGAVKAARQLLDGRAVWLDGDVIRFHPTVRRTALPLCGLEAITHESGSIRSVLWLEHDGGKRIKVVMVDHDAATAFVSEARQAKTRLSAF